MDYKTAENGWENGQLDFNALKLEYFHVCVCVASMQNI